MTMNSLKLCILYKWGDYAMLGRKFLNTRRPNKLEVFLPTEQLVKQRWSTKYLYFDFKIWYLRGLENKVVDAFLHLPFNETHASIIVVQEHYPTVVRQQVEENSPRIKKAVTEGQNVYSHFTVDSYRYKGHLVIPKRFQLIFLSIPKISL